MSSIRSKVEALNTAIQNGKVLDAFETYYSESIIMQENNEEPRVGKAANRAYEKQFVDAVESWHAADVLSLSTDESNGIAAVEWFFDFTFKGGQRMARKQVSIQHWKDGQIIKEQFYYGS